MSYRRTLTPDDDLALSSALSSASGAPAPSQRRTYHNVLLQSAAIAASPSSPPSITTSTTTATTTATAHAFGFSHLPSSHHYSHLYPHSAQYPTSNSFLSPSSVTTSLTHPSSPSAASGTALPTATSATSATATTSTQSSMIVSASFYDPAQASTIPPPQYQQLSVWDAAFDPGQGYYAQGTTSSGFEDASFAFGYGYAQGEQGQPAQEYHPIAPALRQAQRGIHAQGHTQTHLHPQHQQQTQQLPSTSRSLAHQRMQELLNQTHIHPPQGRGNTQQQQQQENTEMYTQAHIQDNYSTSGSTTGSGDQAYDGGARGSDTSEYNIHGSAEGYYYHDGSIVVGGEINPETGMYRQYAVQQAGGGVDLSLPSAPTLMGAPTVQTHLGPQSHSPNSPFVPTSFTPPTTTHTPGSDSGIYAPPHVQSSHGSLSPASYASYPSNTTGTGTTSSSLDDVSRASGSASISSVSGVSSLPSTSGSSNGISAQGSEGRGGLQLQLVATASASEHMTRHGHGHTASVDTVVGRSPPQAPHEHQQQRSQTGYGHPHPDPQMQTQPSSRVAHQILFGYQHQQQQQQFNPNPSVPHIHHQTPPHQRQQHIQSRPTQGRAQQPQPQHSHTSSSIPQPAMALAPPSHSNYPIHMGRNAMPPHVHVTGPFAPPPLPPPSTSSTLRPTPIPAPLPAGENPGPRTGARVPVPPPPQAQPLQSLQPVRARTSTKQARPPKRPRLSKPGGGAGGMESDEESEEDEIVEWGVPGGAGGGGGGGDGPGPGSSGGGRPSGGVGGGVPVPKKTGACKHCKKLKMKCEFPEGATSCKRCTGSGYPCIVEGRKPTHKPNKKEYLLAQIRHKDQIIESLLKQLHNPYTATPLSIASFKLATSPSDKDNVRIVDWMDHLQASMRAPGQPSAARMEMLRELRDPGTATGTTAMDESDDADGGDEETTEEEDAEKVSSALPDPTVPIGLLAKLSLDKEKEKEKGKGRGKQGGGGSGSGGNGGTSSSHVKPEDDDDNVGLANKEYFRPGPANDLNIRKKLIEQHSPPDIVLHGLVTPADVDKLFEIFWNQINPFIGLLDPKLHTASTIFQRCPFLFTVICAISSRYYPAKSEIYPVAMHFAKHSAANALIDGWKSVELCQAYILMSIYAVPARRWEEDRSWLYTGLAVRIATDLNLHQVPTTQPQTERQEREMLNRTRVWMICFNVDRSTATQFGKPSTIKEDYITRNSADWYRQSQYRDKYDIHLCAYSSLLRIVGRFHDDIFSDPSSPTGLNKSIDFLAVTLEHDEHLKAYFEEWTKRFQEESDHNDPGCAFRCTLLPFLVNYSRLVMYSFGFQHAFQRGMEASDHVFLTKCFEAATVVIKHMIEVLAPSGLMRSSPDGHFIFASFASAFLLKLLRPEFAQLLTREMEDEIFESIGRLITTLQDVAIDERHTPRLYARFLAGLLTKHRKGGGGVGGRSHTLPPSSQHARQRQQPGFNRQRPPSSSQVPYSRIQSQSTSETRHDSEAMQMKLSPVPRAAETPPALPPYPTNPPVANNPSLSPDLPYTHQPPLPQGETTFVDTDVGMTDVLSDAGTLATMHALNDVWWGNMMMPGFSWPDATPLMGSLSDGRSNVIPGIHPGFGAFSVPEVQLAM